MDSVLDPSRPSIDWYTQARAFSRLSFDNVSTRKPIWPRLRGSVLEHCFAVNALRILKPDHWQPRRVLCFELPFYIWCNMEWVVQSDSDHICVLETCVKCKNEIHWCICQPPWHNKNSHTYNTSWNSTKSLLGAQIVCKGSACTCNIACHMNLQHIMIRVDTFNQQQQYCLKKMVMLMNHTLDIELALSSVVLHD